MGHTQGCNCRDFEKRIKRLESEQHYAFKLAELDNKSIKRLEEICLKLFDIRTVDRIVIKGIVKKLIRYRFVFDFLDGLEKMGSAWYTFTKFIGFGKKDEQKDIQKTG